MVVDSRGLQRSSGCSQPGYLGTSARHSLTYRVSNDCPSSHSSRNRSRIKCLWYRFHGHAFVLCHHSFHNKKYFVMSQNWKLYPQCTFHSHALRKAKHFETQQSFALERHSLNHYNILYLLIYLYKGTRSV